MSSQVVVSTGLKRRRSAATTVSKKSKTVRSRTPKWTVQRNFASVGKTFPQKLNITHKYVETGEHTFAAATYYTFFYKCNGLFDPRDAIGGHQPLNFRGSSRSLTWKLLQDRFSPTYYIHYRMESYQPVWVSQCFRQPKTSRYCRKWSNGIVTFCIVFLQSIRYRIELVLCLWDWILYYVVWVKEYCRIVNFYYYYIMFFVCVCYICYKRNKRA